MRNNSIYRISFYPPYIDKTSEKGKGLMKRIKNQKKSLHYNAFQKSIKSLYFP